MGDELPGIVLNRAETEEQFLDTLDAFEPEGPEEIDWDNDPLIEPGRTAENAKWSREFFTQFTPRKPGEISEDDTLRQQMRDLLVEMEAGPPESSREGAEEGLTEWLRLVEEKLLPVEGFVAGSFGRHAAAWEELLGQSSRPSSKAVLSCIKNGIKPSFVGTADADPKKRERVRRMIRRVVGKSRVEEWLSGQVPHTIELPNHRSFSGNSEFGIQAVGEMLVNSTVRMYGEGERRPKVVNPLGVANLPKRRLVLDAGYINLFTKHIPFRYETLREILSFL
jgi:hypothetical protein